MLVSDRGQLWLSSVRSEQIEITLMIIKLLFANKISQLQSSETWIFHCSENPEKPKEIFQIFCLQITVSIHIHRGSRRDSLEISWISTCFGLIESRFLLTEVFKLLG